MFDMRPTTRTTAILLLLANLFFWVYFWVDFGRRLVPYRVHCPAFEELLPAFVFHGNALPASEETRAPSLRLAERVQMPSFLAIRPVVHILNYRPSSWTETFWGISPWGYLLIAVMLLSFLQWYLVARFVGWLIARFRRTYPATDLRVRRTSR